MFQKTNRFLRQHKCTFYVQQSPPRKSCRLWDNVEKYGKAGQATEDNVSQPHCMLDNYELNTDVHWEYVVLIASPLQQLFNGCASMLRHTYTAWFLKHYCRKLYAQNNSCTTHTQLWRPGSLPLNPVYIHLSGPLEVADRPVILRPPHRKIRAQNHQAYPCLEWDSNP